MGFKIPYAEYALPTLLVRNVTRQARTRPCSRPAASRPAAGPGQPGGGGWHDSDPDRAVQESVARPAPTAAAGPGSQTSH